MTLPLAIPLGDPAGIGPEITALAWEARQERSLAPFFAVGDERSIRAVWNGPVQRIIDPAEARNVFTDALPLMQIEDAGEIMPGKPSPDGARCALAALEAGIGLTRSGAAGGLVTGPVSKAQLYGVGFTHAGQTEFVAERCGVAADNTAMMLAGPGLRVVPITTHMALANVAQTLSIELILAKARVTARGLTRNFGIALPRLAFAGFNPHAGEDGAMGREEIDIIQPAIAQLVREGIVATGPHAADGLFQPRMRDRYDVAMCMYHDQGLIPLKALYFDEGVNLTLGLPIVRTAPDHGTAFEIAGLGMANPGAMIAAIEMAAQATVHRARYQCPKAA